MQVNTDFNSGSTTEWSITTSSSTDYYYNIWYDDNSKWDWYGNSTAVRRPEPANWDEILKIIQKDNRHEKEEENLMRVYEVIVIDAKECEILKQQNVIAKDTETAMLEMDLTPEVRKQVKKGDVKFIFNELGSFEKVEKQIRVKEIVEE